MERFPLTFLLLGVVFFAACCAFSNGFAQTNNVAEVEVMFGKIEMDVPDAPLPKMAFNLDRDFFKLFMTSGSHLKLAGDKSVVLTEHIEMLNGAAIRTYNKETEDLKNVIDHYQEIFEAKKWERLVKIEDKFDLSLLYAEEQGIVHGIFLMFTNDKETSFVNIYGEMDFQKLGVLFGQFLESNSEVEILENVRGWVKGHAPQWLKVAVSSGELEDDPKSETETNDNSN